MPKGREELRRGVRDLIETASREMGALEGQAPPDAPDALPAEPADRPILRLVREPARPAPQEAVPAPPAAAPGEPAAPAADLRGTSAPPDEAAHPSAPPVAPAPPVPAATSPAAAPPAAAPAPPGGMLAPVYGIPADASGVHPRKGVCAAYYINHACWEVPDAPCNQALHVCMLRECPVYALNREEMERRFAAKFAHLW